MENNRDRPVVPNANREEYKKQYQRKNSQANPAGQKMYNIHL